MTMHTPHVTRNATAATFVRAAVSVVEATAAALIVFLLVTAITSLILG